MHSFDRIGRNGGSLVLVAVYSLAACSGCHMGDGWKFAKLDNVRQALGMKPKKPEPENPTRLVTTWSEAVLSRAGQKPQRGFGGRLVFFNDKHPDPVRVEGQLVVYAYDETDRPATETQPTRRYVFPAAQLSVYESQSKLGPSYSVWLPWDDDGGPQKKVSLIARFEPKAGPTIVGEQTRQMLPGPALPPGPEQQLANNGDGVRQASYQTPANPAGVAGINAPSGISVAPASFNRPSTSAAAASTVQGGLADPPSLDTTTIHLPRRLPNGPAAPIREPANYAKPPAENPATAALNQMQTPPRSVPTSGLVPSAGMSQEAFATALSMEAARAGVKAPSPIAPMGQGLQPGQWSKDSVFGTPPAQATQAPQ